MLCNRRMLFILCYSHGPYMILVNICFTLLAHSVVIRMVVFFSHTPRPLFSLEGGWICVFLFFWHWFSSVLFSENYHRFWVGCLVCFLTGLKRSEIIFEREGRCSTYDLTQHNCYAMSASREQNVFGISMFDVHWVWCARDICWYVLGNLWLDAPLNKLILPTNYSKIFTLF